MTDSDWLEQVNCPLPANEVLRIKAYEKYEPSDKAPEQEEAFTRLATLAARFTGLPVCYINLVAPEYQYHKASNINDKEVLPRRLSFCQFTIMSGEILEVEDTHKHPVFRHNPFSWPTENNPFCIRYYVGVPLRTPDGFYIGSLCLVDHQPNKISDTAREVLQMLADEVISSFELKAAKAELEAINKEKDELIRIVSHDLRNPLIGVTGFAEILRDELDDDQHKEMASIIMQSGEATLSIVNILLSSDYVKNETLRINRKICDVAEITQGILTLVRPLSMLKNQRLETDIPETLSWKVDVEKWKQIVGNLLNNAIKFTPNEGTVRMKIYAADEKTLKLEIADSGVGMDGDQLKNLFSGKKKFHRLGTNGEDTSGLGMVLIKKYTDLHGGNIEVSSKPGEGTSFTVTLPA